MAEQPRLSVMQSVVQIQEGKGKRPPPPPFSTARRPLGVVTPGGKVCVCVCVGERSRVVTYLFQEFKGTKSLPRWQGTSSDIKEIVWLLPFL